MQSPINKSKINQSAFRQRADSDSSSFEKFSEPDQENYNSKGLQSPNYFCIPEDKPNNQREKMEKIRRQLDELSPKHYAKIFESNNIAISNLSSTKYGKISSNHQNHTINILPELGKKSEQRKKMPFISFNDIKYINQNIINYLEDSIVNSQKIDPRELDSTVNKYSKLFPSTAKSNSHHTASMSSIKNELPPSAHYSRKQIINFELTHNKDTSKSLKNLNLSQHSKRNKEAEVIREQYQKLIHIQPKPKIYDSKHYHKIKQRMKRENEQLLDHIQQEDFLQTNTQKEQRLTKSQHSNQKPPPPSNSNNNNTPNSPTYKDKTPKNKNHHKKVSFIDYNNGQLQNKFINGRMSDYLESYMYKTYWYNFEQHHWRPNVRENAAMAVFGKKVYVYGGLGIQDTNEICVLDIETLKWSVIKTHFGERPRNSRHAHACLPYKKLFIIFGGFQNLITDKGSTSETLLDMRVFNIETYEWKKITPSGDYILPRRNFASSIFGKHIIVHGGIDARENFVNDLWIFEVQNLRWSNAICDEPIGFAQQGVAYHSCCNVFNYEKKNQILYKMIDNQNEKFNKIKIEGVYFFGGKKQIQQKKVMADQQEQNEFLGQLLILKVEQKPLQWIAPETKGRVPAPRYSCSMVFNHILEYVFIYGGRNEKLTPSGFLDDCWVLTLDSLTWIQVTIEGIEKKPCRGAHCAFSYDTKMYIFGGFNNEGFCNSNVEVMELERTQAEKLHQEHIKENEKQAAEKEQEEKKKNQLDKKKSVTAKMIEMWKDSTLYADFEEISEQKKRNFRQEMAAKMKKDIQSIEKKQDHISDQIYKLQFSNSVTYNPMPVQKTLAQINLENQELKSQKESKQNSVAELPEEEGADDTNRKQEKKKQENVINAVLNMHQINEKKLQHEHEKNMKELSLNRQVSMDSNTDLPIISPQPQKFSESNLQKIRQSQRRLSHLTPKKSQSPVNSPKMNSPVQKKSQEQKKQLQNNSKFSQYVEANLEMDQRQPDSIQDKINKLDLTKVNNNKVSKNRQSEDNTQYYNNKKIDKIE